MKLKSFFTLKRTLLCLAILILLVCLACVGVLLIKHQHKLARFNNALEAFNNGDYESAKKQFEKCLWDQYNNEAVNEKLAIIAEHENDWGRASVYWQRAAALNPFKQEYADSLLKALKMSRNFAAIIRYLEPKKNKGGITNDQSFLLAYSYLQIGDSGVDKAKELFASIQAPHKGNALAEILEFFLSPDQHTIQQSLDFLQKYHNHNDPFIALETIYGTANRYAQINDIEKGRECMKRVAEINPYVGKPLQADYLYTLGAISEAMPILEECVEKNATNLMGFLLGECYLITNQPEKLEKLCERFKTGNVTRVTTGYYLEALHAYLTKDNKRLVSCIDKCSDNFTSPVAMNLKLHAATLAEAPERFIAILRQILSNDTYRVYRKAAIDIAKQYVHDLFTKRQVPQAVAIAEIIYDQNNPDLYLTRLLIHSKLANNTLTQPDIDFVESKFKNDPILLGYIARYYLYNGNAEAALKASQNNLTANHELPLDLTPIRLQQLSALEALNKLDEAKKAALDMLESDKKQIGINILYIDFCTNNNLVDELKAYAKSLGTPESEDFKALQCFALAQAAFLSEDKQEAITQLDKITNAIPAIMNKVGLLYASMQNHEKANAAYQKIIDKGIETDLIYLNMSENCTAAGKKEQALEYAKKALALSPNRDLVKETYALRLHDSGQVDEAFHILDSLILEKKMGTPRGTLLWRIIMGDRVNKMLEDKKFNEGLTELKRMQLVFPDDEKVKKVIEQVETTMQEEKEAKEREEQEKEKGKK